MPYSKRHFENVASFGLMVAFSVASLPVAAVAGSVSRTGGGASGAPLSVPRSGRTVVADLGGAEIRLARGRGADPIAAFGDVVEGFVVEQRVDVQRVRSGEGPRVVVCQAPSPRPRSGRRRWFRPRGPTVRRSWFGSAVAVVGGHGGVLVADDGDVVVGPAGAGGVLLPGRLRFAAAAATGAGDFDQPRFRVFFFAEPDGLLPAPRFGFGDGFRGERGAPDAITPG